MAFHSKLQEGSPPAGRMATQGRVRWSRVLIGGTSLAVSALALLAVLWPAPASAHHLMGLFQLNQGPLAGFLSGLGHPLLGPDHLLFLLSVGLVALSRPWGWVLALLAAGLGGNALGLWLPQVPGVELLVGLSLVATGLVVVRKLPAPVLIPLYAFHGAALSSSVIGWETTPITCYLGGLLVSQSLVLLLALTVVRRWRSIASDQALTLVAGLLIGLGLAFSWTTLVP